ncbi:MAG: hypothetical protein ACE5I1_05420 [bacterium]
MAKSTSLDEKLKRIDTFLLQPKSAETAKALQGFLGAKNNYLVAKAARVVSECGYDELIPNLLMAFDYFLKHAEKTDKSCLAKTAIIKALQELGHSDSDIFLRGVRYYQLEPSYGGRVDTATEIRSLCAYTLVDLNNRDVLYELIRLTADPELQVQVAAVRAMANTGMHEAELLLRLLATSGDRELSVISECLSGLMHLAPAQSFDFVAGFLDSHHEQLRQAAALALAESHSAEAFAFLLEYWQSHPDYCTRRMLAIPLAISKRSEAIDFLLSIIEQEDDQIAFDVLKALKIYRHDEDFITRLGELIEKKGDRILKDYFHRTFL